MKKLLLTLTLAAGATSLHGMEPQKQLSPISLAQTYHQFLHSDPALLPEITQQIFSLQLQACGVDLVKLTHVNCKDPQSFVPYLKSLLNSCGYELSSRLFKYYLSHTKISICDIKDVAFGRTILHKAIPYGHTEIVNLLLNAAGNNVWTLLTMKDTSDWTGLYEAAHYGHTEIAKLLLNAASDKVQNLILMPAKDSSTALHEAVHRNHIEIVKLLLNAAGNKVKDFITIRDKYGKTAFDIAKPKVKEVMQPYLHKNNQ